MKNTKSFVFMGLLIALDIVLTRFLSIQTPILRIGFGFIPVALAGIMFGPIWGGVTAALGDIIGMLIFPQGAYFPGFTLSAFISGAVYGLFLHKKSKSILNISIAVLLIIIVVDLGFNSLWLSMITGKAFIVLIVPRIVKSAIMLSIQVLTIFTVWRFVGAYIETQFLNVKYDY